MRSSIPGIVLALLLALAPGLAAAGEGCEGHAALSTVEHIFVMADQNGDGALSPAEYGSAGLEGYGVSFQETDADGNGETSLDEYIEIYERHHPDEERVSL